MNVFLGAVGGGGLVLVWAMFTRSVLAASGATRGARAALALFGVAALTGSILVAVHSGLGALAGLVFALGGLRAARWVSAARTPVPDIVVDRPLLADATLSPDLMAEMLRLEADAREGHLRASDSGPENARAQS